MRKYPIWTSGLLALGLLACSGKGTPADVGSKEDAFEGDLKADCLDCDPADLRSAFEQASLGRDGFYRKGTTWTVAWQFREDRSFEKHILGPDEVRPAASLGDLFVFDYRVDEVSRRIIGDHRRDVAHIQITQTAELGPFAGLAATDRLDTDTFQIDLLMDDLFRPVEKVYYDRAHPHGRRVGRSALGRVRSAMDPFPADVPDVTVADTATAPLPAVTPEMKAIGAKAAELGWLAADWDTRTDLRHFDLEGANGSAEVWWAPGDLWPTYVRTHRGEGILVRQLEP